MDRSRPRLGWAATIVWLSLTPSPPQLDVQFGDKLGHFGAYGLLMFWFTRCMPRKRSSGRGTPSAFIAMGMALEIPARPPRLSYVPT